MLTPEEKRRIVDQAGCTYCRQPAGSWCVVKTLARYPRKAYRLHGARISRAVKLGLITRNVQAAEMTRRGSGPRWRRIFP